MLNGRSCIFITAKMVAAGLATLVTITPGRAEVSFDESVFPVGRNPEAIVVTDIDGDAVPDLITADSFSNTVTVLRGLGPAGFATGVAYAVGRRPVSIVAADLDHDGAVDLAVADRLDDSVSVLAGDGAGGFGAAVTYAVGRQPEWVGAGDLDEDGRQDLVVANRGSGDLTVLLSLPGGWSAVPAVALGRSPGAGVVADLNRDGWPDVAVTDSLDDTITVLLGRGDGTFESPVAYAVGRNPTAVVAADLDGDGWLDLSVACRVDNQVTVWMGLGGGTFGLPRAFAAANPGALAAGDFDGDCIQDLAVSPTAPGAVVVLPGDGSGSLGSPLSLPSASTSPQGLAAGDFDGDLRADLAVANRDSDAVAIRSNAAVATCDTFYVRRSTDPSAVRGAAIHATVHRAPFDDVAGVLSDDRLLFYVVEHAGGLAMRLSAHRDRSNDTVRLGFADGDPASAPADPTTSTVSLTAAAVPGDGGSTLRAQVVPRDASGVPLGAGLHVEVDAAALLPGAVTDVIRDLGDGTYVFDVASPTSGAGTVLVTVEGTTLADTPTVLFTVP